MIATAIRDENAIAASLNAVVVYDTFDSAVKAKRVLERDWAGEPTHWNVKPWRVDVLKIPPAAEVALTEAADAHLILIAVPRFESFLPWLVDWLDRWATCRKVKEAGLALWDCGRPIHARFEHPPELSQFAEHHGMSLICDAAALFEDKSSAVVKDLDDYAQHFQHWGINE
jgi:hypothetical protein